MSRTELRIKAALRDSPVIGVDETGLRVAGGGSYIHVARTEKLLLKIKSKVAEVNGELDEPVKSGFLRLYDRLVKKAASLNPPKSVAIGDVLRNKSPAGPTPCSLIKRLQRRRDEVLRFMADRSVPFDNNGSERDLRMVKLQQKISGCFRTSDGVRNFCRVRSYLSTARKQGHSLLYSLEHVRLASRFFFKSLNLPLRPE